MIPSQRKATIAGREVHRIGFGTMQLPGPGVMGPPRDRDQAIAVLRAAVEGGVNHIDTAQYYGPDVANELMRDALHPYDDDLVIVSKVGATRDAEGNWPPAPRPEEMRADVMANLRSLVKEQIPVVNLRRFRDSDVPFLEQLDAMIELRDEGHIGAIGLSNVTLDEYVTAGERTEIACVQNEYNLLNREDQALLDLCGAHRVPYVPFFPLGSPELGGSVLTQPVVQDVAARLGVLPAQVALAWLLTRGPHILLIPGTSSLDHLAVNLAVADVELDEDALIALEGAVLQSVPR